MLRVVLPVMALMVLLGASYPVLAEEAKSGTRSEHVVELNLLDEPPPYETIWGLTRIQVYKKPGFKKMKLFHYTLIDGQQVVMKRKLKGVVDRTKFEDSHPRWHRLGDWCQRGGQLAGAAALLLAGAK